MLAAAGAETFLIAATVNFLASLTGTSERGDFLLGLPVAAGDSLTTTAAAMFAASAVLAGVMRMSLVVLTQKFTFQLGHELAVEVQRRVLGQKYGYHLEHNSSELVASLEKVQTVASAIVLQVLQGLSGLVIAAFIVAVLLTLDPAVAAAAVVGFAALYVAAGRLTRNRLRANSLVLEQAYDDRVRLLQESVGTIRDILIHKSAGPYVDEFRKVDARFARSAASTAATAALPRYFVETAGMVLFAILAVTVTGTRGFADAIPLLGGLAVAAQRLLPLAQQTYQAWARLTGEGSVVRQVIALLQLPIDEGSSSAEPLPFRDSIVLEEVSFHYPRRRVPAVHDISLTIRKSQRVAFVGRNGSGKTTLADLVLGLLEPASGRILVDDVPLDSSTRSRWQDHIAHVPQHVFLADTSILRNIALGVGVSEIDRPRVERAAELAHLAGFIGSLPDGYDTAVGEQGLRLSGGQRQRIGLARAIYRSPSLLVLDEPSSALDDETELGLLAMLDELKRQHCTVIVISHRSSSLRDCDVLFELQEGRLVATRDRPGGTEQVVRTTGL